MKLSIPRIFPIFFFFIISLQTEAQKLAVVPYVSGINSPIDLKHCGDDRLFVADQGGLIRIIDADGTLRTTPFLDFTSEVSSAKKVFWEWLSAPIIKQTGNFMWITLQLFRVS